MGVPAVSLSLSGPLGFGARLARNEVFSKAGNFTALGITGYLTQRHGLQWMFPVIYTSAALVFINSLFLPKVQTERDTKPATWAEKKQALLPVLASPAFLQLACLTFLYFLANSSMLFVFEQRFVPMRPNGGAGFISSAQAATQAVIFCASIFLARANTDRKPISFLGFGFALMMVRGILFAASGSILSLFAGQILDGVIAAIVLIVPVKALSRMAEKNFNLLSGSFGTFCSLGASISMVSAGYLLPGLGHERTFLAFAAVAAIGACASLLKVKMPPEMNMLPTAA